MRVGLVVPGGFDPGGRQGVIPALVSLAEELARRHEVHVFAAAGRAGAARYRVADVAVTQRPGREPAAALTAGLWRWWRAAGPFDVLHAFWADRTALLAVALARLRGVRAVVSLGGGEVVWLPDLEYGGAGTARSRAVTRTALRLAGAITAGSAFVARLLPADLARNVQLVPLGVDAARFAAAPERPAGPPWRLV
ncbi:MAG TPA: glycosyltransferase, partial [Polyangia bacterium]|nr:glycosyltransferase [Polyangia bacterium]